MRQNKSRMAGLVAGLQRKWSFADYNFKHFRTKHFITDTLATLVKIGVQPGEPAPDFSLPDTAGGEFRLSSLRGQPVLLRFGSTT